MDIPLKSKAKVSLIDIPTLHPERNNSRSPDVKNPDLEGPQLSKLTRTYSETEVNNFDEETGHRLYDDELFRPKKRSTPQELGVQKIYSRSHGRPFGLEDEYIPGLNFSDMIYKWSDTPDLSRTNSTNSFLDLNDLHARVSPKKINSVLPTLRRSKTNQSDYDLILISLPSNFNDLPYSQRKKLVKSINENVDYSQFSVYIKNYFGKKTLAGRLLSSTTDLKKMIPVNVDEKGARVMEYTLGKVIGFGAWGTIRECHDVALNVYAMKIVSSKNTNVLTIFKREIYMWEQMDHPNILKLYKYLETEDTTFCLMKRVNGGTLFELVLKWGVIEVADEPALDDEDGDKLGSFLHPVESSQSVASLQITTNRRIHLVSLYIRQIVNALHYMHKAGIVHGDLKLENVLVEKSQVFEEEWEMILCDFGMTRYYKKKSTTSVRSKSSMSEIRKPYTGESSHSKLLMEELNNRSRNLLQLKSLSRSNSPLKKEPSHHHSSLESIRKFVDEMKAKELKRESQVDLNLPDSHIGSLPYASPELLLPSPPPLGPSADVWALGILIYTMVIGRLPFQHSYEPRLRAMIIKGNFNRKQLSQVLEDFPWLDELINGCLEMNITKRLDIELIKEMIERNVA